MGSGAIQTADLNGDGLPDIIVTNYKTQNISIFLSIAPKLTPTVSVQSNFAQALVGSSVAIAVQVKGPGSVIPTGTVTLAAGSMSFGQQTLDATGTANFTLQGLAVGQYSLLASYAGDKSYLAASAAAFTQSITDFQITLPSTTETVQAGASATYPVNLAPLAAFSGSVSLACSGLPGGYTCTPATATLSGQPATVSLVVAPPATTANLKRDAASPTWARSVTLCGLLGLCFYARRRRLPMLFTLTLTLLSLGSLVGCSHGPKLYTGTSTFTITATATQNSQTVSHQATATLVVQ